MTIDTSSEPGTLAQDISRMAGLLRGGAFSNGDLAALRRMDPRRPGAAFFKLEGMALDGRLPGTAGALEDLETRWAVVAQGLAYLGALHRPGPAHRLGLVLGASGYTEVRFERLLGADPDRLVDELPRLARYLAAKSLQADWTGAASLMLSAGHAAGEAQRRHIARDYYGVLARHDHH